MKWLCDDCDEIIENAEQGWIEWWSDFVPFSNISENFNKYGSQLTSKQEDKIDEYENEHENYNIELDAAIEEYGKNSDDLALYLEENSKPEPPEFLINYGFRIIHFSPYSPRFPSNCYKLLYEEQTNGPLLSDSHLNIFIDNLDKYKNENILFNNDEFQELTNRLTEPGYENLNKVDNEKKNIPDLKFVDPNEKIEFDKILKFDDIELKFYSDLFKGKIGEIIVQLILEIFKYTVIAIGLENKISKEDMKKSRSSPNYNYQNEPDLMVSKDGFRKKIEVKSTNVSKEKWMIKKSILENIQKYHPTTILIVIHLSDFSLFAIDVDNINKRKFEQSNSAYIYFNLDEEFQSINSIFSDIENEQLSKFTEQLKIKFLTIAEKIDN